MQQRSIDADRLVFRAISADFTRSGAPQHTTVQELPDLGEVGAAVARSARMAAARHRAFLPRLVGARSQAAGLLEPDAAERDALFADLGSASEPEEGRLIPPASPHGGFVWRLHPAPQDAGPGVASPGEHPR